MINLPYSLGICFSNYTIVPIFHPSTDKPCLSCTKQWCLDQKLEICTDAKLGDSNPDTATGKEGDVEARCFRESLILAVFVSLGYEEFTDENLDAL